MEMNIASAIIGNSYSFLFCEEEYSQTVSNGEDSDNAFAPRLKGFYVPVAIKRELKDGREERIELAGTIK